jgi:hypothetical protein
MHDIIEERMQQDGIDPADEIVVDCAAYGMLPALHDSTDTDDIISAGELADILADDFDRRFVFWFGDDFDNCTDEDMLRRKVTPAHVRTCAGAFLHGWTELADDVEERLQAEERSRQLDLFAAAEEGDE